jgi:hypothetical protein
VTGLVSIEENHKRCHYNLQTSMEPDTVGFLQRNIFIFRAFEYVLEA